MNDPASAPPIPVPRWGSGQQNDSCIISLAYFLKFEESSNKRSCFPQVVDKIGRITETSN